MGRYFSELYWSQNLKCLISRHPLSSAYEVIAYFCPQCLTRYSEDDVNVFHGLCPCCYKCPCCTAVLALEGHRLSCGLCLWSKEVDLAALKNYRSDMFLSRGIQDRQSESIFRSLVRSYVGEHKQSMSDVRRSKVHDTLPKGEWQLDQLKAALDDEKIATFSIEDNLVMTGPDMKEDYFSRESACSSRSDNTVSNVSQRWSNAAFTVLYLC